MRGLTVVALLAFACWPDSSARLRCQTGRWSMEPNRVRSGSRRPWSTPARAAVLGVVLGVTVDSPLLVVASPVVVAGVWSEGIRRRRHRGDGARSAAMLVFLETAVAELRAGGSLPAAVTRAIEYDRRSSVEAGQASNPNDPAIQRHPALERVAAALAAGRPLTAAFSDSFADDAVTGDERVVAATIIALHGSGGAAVDALERVAETLRERRAWQDELRTQAQQALSSAAVMSVLPFVFGVGAAMADPGVAQLYRSQWSGAICAGAALLLALLGWEWQQRLVAVR